MKFLGDSLGRGGRVFWGRSYIGGYALLSWTEILVVRCVAFLSIQINGGVDD
jgi:hypothetical protein